MLLHRHEMQPLAALRILAPGLQCREEIDAEAEAGLEDRECAPAAPALGQAVAAEENVPRLLGPALGAVIDVTELRRIRRAFGRERKPRRHQGCRHAGSQASAGSTRTSRSGLGKAMSRARNASRIARLISPVVATASGTL